MTKNKLECFYSSVIIPVIIIRLISIYYLKNIAVVLTIILTVILTKVHTKHFSK
jgi:hypothetical protein